MNQRRSIQDIIPPARSKPIREAVRREASPEESVQPSKLPPRRPSNPRREKRPRGGVAGLLGIALGVLVVVGVAFGIVSTFFHRAEVTIELNRFPVNIAETFEASPDGALLSFTEKSAESLETASAPQSGSEYVEERASGTITVFNAHSKSSQRLITNTRFEAAGGLIYRVKSPVVVPGYTTVDGATVPGQIDVTVFADEPGEKYNVGPTEFTIPGLKGTDQYESMYARSKGSISGGFVGEKAVVDPAVRATTVASLKEKAEAAARQKLLDALKDDEIVFPDSVTVDFVEQPDKAGSDGAQISVSAVATAPVFNEETLARRIAEEGGISYDAPLRIENDSQVLIEAAPSETAGNLSVTISGDAVLVGTYDEGRLIQDLSGKDRRSVGVVLSGYPAISDMRISVYPFWRGVLPNDPGRIKITEEGEDR